MSKVVSTLGPEYDLSFTKWLIGASVPASIVILIVPQAICMYLKQSNIDLEHTKTYSERMLRQMKSMSSDEKVNIYSFFFFQLLFIIFKYKINNKYLV